MNEITFDISAFKQRRIEFNTENPFKFNSTQELLECPAILDYIKTIDGEIFESFSIHSSHLVVNFTHESLDCRIIRAIGKISDPDTVDLPKWDSSKML